jgi:ribosomal protein S18 acetylase RimI-like enzyme
MKPYLKNISTNEVERAVTRRLTKNDLGELSRAQESAVAALEDKSLYIPKSREDFEKILASGEIYGIFTRNRLCGACCVFMPGDSPENLGSDIYIPPEELALCAVVDGLFVAPDYRGNGISRELLCLCIERAAEALGARHVLAAVSPKNIPCILNFMSISGMRVAALRQKYGCRLRYIMRYTHGDKRLYTIYERYPLGDVYSVSRALADGYEGIAIFKAEDAAYIWMSK